MTACESDFEIVWTDWETRNFGRVRIPRMLRVLSLDAAARLLGRIDDAMKARQRFESIRAVDALLAGIAEQWPAFNAMSTQDFAVLCRFLAQISAQGSPKTRLREVPCAGMHTKFLENHRALLVPAMAALEPFQPGCQKLGGKAWLHRRRDPPVRASRSRRRLAALPAPRPAGHRAYAPSH
jgi:hypothetical protein